ncbi:hypothetical protein J4Q44_G00059420 [Coregonus suidteri]|uniref:Uncharacterized protein n=1 Tax=Coregonus suidteri TaxID=861788 RepID=A0AAN8MB53_9TELE
MSNFIGNMSASEKITKELSESDALETDPKVRLSSQSDEGDTSTATAVITMETEPMGGMLSQSLFQEIQGDGSKNGEESEQLSTTSSSVSGRNLAGHAAKTLPSTSSSLSSTSSPSGRAKMSVFGPGSKALPPHPSSSSPHPSSSSPPPVTGQTAKIHRARKTMNRPPPTQVRCIESPIVPVNPTDPTTSFTTESDTAAKRRRLGQGYDGTPEKAESSIGTEQKADRVLREAARRRDSWLEDLEEDADEDEFLLYNPYARDDTDAAYSDSKSEDGGIEGRLHERDAEESGNMSDHSSESGPQRLGQRNKVSSDSPWTRPILIFII